MFNPQYCDLTPENSYWISGEDQHGETIVTQAGRIFYWPETTLEDEARLMFYGRHDVAPVLVEKGVAAGYGYQHQSRSIFFPASRYGDLEVVVNYLSASEAYADLANFLTTAPSVSSGAEGAMMELAKHLDQSVTRTSSNDVFHGPVNFS